MLRRLAIVFLLTGCGPSATAPAGEAGPARFALRGRWPGLSPDAPIPVRVEPAGGPLAPEAFQRAVRAALDEWQATGLVAFRPAVAGEPAQLVIGWRQGAHGAPCLPFGIDSAIAHAGPVGPGTFVHLDLERDWTPGDGGHDPVNALLHEIGHTLGLDHTPDETAVMCSEPGSSRRVLARSDRLGLETLYGDPSRDVEPGSLRVFLDGDRAPCAALRGVAPAGSRWTLFDADGDGRDEILTWTTDGAQELWAFHLDGEGRPERTVGPILGLAAAGAELRFGRDDEGARLVVVAFGERRHAVALDASGRPLGLRDGAPTSETLEPVPRAEGDVTGDGRRATIRP